MQVLLPLDEMFIAPPAPVAAARPAGNLTWTAIPEFLEAEIAAGASASSRKKARTAVNGLLRARKLTAENAYINLDWFDRTFPLLTGWDPLMDIEPGTGVDYVYRVRPVIERMTGADVAKRELRAAVDGWTELGEHLRGLDAFQDPGPSKRLIPICSTLTQAARRARLQPRDIDQVRLRQLHDEAHKGEISSLRKASELIAELQSTTPSIRAWFPGAIVPIEARGPRRYAVPAQLRDEVEHFVELASRRRYIRAKRTYEYVKDGTRTNFRTTMHAVVGGLIAAALMFLSIIPLRNQDTVLRWGEHIRHLADDDPADDPDEDGEPEPLGYHLDLRTSKRGVELPGPLAPILTPYLDALILQGRDERLLPQLRKQAAMARLPVFPKSGGRARGVDSLSERWRAHLGVGSGISRTRIHTMLGNLGEHGVRAALALCAQRSARTARWYQADALARRQMLGSQEMIVELVEPSEEDIELLAALGDAGANDVRRAEP